MISIHRLAPQCYVLFCPVRGYFHTAAATQSVARLTSASATCAKAGKPNWLTEGELDLALQELGIRPRSVNVESL
jgi:hypothetical protein